MVIRFMGLDLSLDTRLIGASWLSKTQRIEIAHYRNNSKAFHFGFPGSLRRNS